MAWRQEAVWTVMRKRRQGIHGTFAQIANKIKQDPGRGRRPWLSTKGLRQAYKKYSEEIQAESEFYSSDEDNDNRN